MGFHTRTEDAYLDAKQVNSSGKSGLFGKDRPAPAPYMPLCPECSSARVWKDGRRKVTLPINNVQRWLCRDCGYRFSELTLTNKKTNQHTSKYQVCADEKEAKNLATVETRTQEKAAGATETRLSTDKMTDTATVKGKIVEFLWYLKKQGYASSTVKTYVSILKTLRRKGADIFNPENVKLIIAQQEEQKKWSSGRRANIIKAYALFLKMQGLEWDQPRYNPKKGLPRPPTPEQVKQLVAAASRKYAPIFRFMAETGASPIEASIMTKKNFDLERNLVYVEGRKGHLDRVVPISAELAALMRTWLARYEVFPSNDMIGRKYRKYRDRLAVKLNDDAIKNIRLYDFRHYFGTMTYARTKDILYVKDLMGHSKIETTMIYTKLVAFPQDEEFICKVAKTVEEASELVEAGFDYVTDVDGVKLFRKRKALIKGAWSTAKGPWSSMDPRATGDISRKPPSFSFFVVVWGYQVERRTSNVCLS